MSSGSYFPPPVKAVEIPKPHGGVRVLGVPTVADRVAQTVVAMHLGERAESRFHPDSYGYRPGKSALDAVGVCRKRCWKFDWVIDLDVQKFFDTVPWDLVVKAVEAVTTTSWVLLYVKRWLKAPLQLPDGTLSERDKGTPQGSAVSPVLANLFMHFAFDAWMARSFPDCPFERYADKRRDDHDHTGFTFLGFALRARKARNRYGQYFSSFLPAMSPEALKAKSVQLRSMRLHRRIDLTLGDLARWLNPIVGGWLNYYGRFYWSQMAPFLQRINSYLRRWARNKYRRLRTHKAFRRWWAGLLDRQPSLFRHWKWVNVY